MISQIKRQLFIRLPFGHLDDKKGNSYTMNLAACGGIFFDRINKINMIFLYSFYPEHPVYPV